MAQDDLRKVRQGAREIRGTTREIKGTVTDSKAIANEIKGDRNKEPDSPAKSYIKKFWEYIEKMEATPNDVNILGTNSRAASTAINNIKIKDKNYDVTPLEAELEKWKAAYNNALNGNQNQRTGNASLLTLLEILYKVNTHVPPREIDQKKIEIETYKSKTAELVALNVDPTDKVNAATIHTVKTKIEVDLRGLDSNIQRLETDITSMEDEPSIKAYYLIIQYEVAHWDALRKGPFVDKTLYENGYKKMIALQSRVGSLESLLDGAKVKTQNRIKNTRMPAAVVQNAFMESIFRQSFDDLKYGETLVKVHLLERDWTAVRNEVTGVLEGRTQRAALVAKSKDGRYVLYNNFIIRQDFLGNAYSTQTKVLLFETTEILEENIR